MKQTITDELCNKVGELTKSGVDGISIAYQLTDIVDRLLISTYETVIKDFFDSEKLLQNIGVTLVAVGGYGRREIAPYSDIDIMLLARDNEKVAKEAAHAVLYRLWDIGLNISHSFRTLKGCIEDAMKDIQTRTTIMESRFLAGSKNIFDEFNKEVYQKLLYKEKRNFIGEILRDIDKRHRTYGDSLYLLEPNVKEGIGSLRDIHSISWLLKVSPGINSIAEYRKFLSENNYKDFIQAYQFLLKTRACLHYVSKRKNDILSFDLQDGVSSMLGFRDTMSYLASEIMMRVYYRNSKNIIDVLSKAKNMCSSRYINIPVSFSVKKITDDFYISKNEIIVKNKEIFKDADKILEAFHIYSIAGKRFSYRVREALKDSSFYINGETHLSKKAVRHFWEILKGNRVYETLREMYDTGILGRFIPEFGRLRHLVIFAPYHRYTVDEHTLIAIKNLEMLKTTRHAKLQYLTDIFKNVKQEVLFIAILLHDIGKGTSRKHEDVGYRILKGVLERLDIENSDDRGRIEFLVKNHVLLSKLALTRDADAYETITQLAEVVSNEENLNALYLITYADMTAVNPNFWTEWKAYLFHDIYIKTRNHLHGIREHYFNMSDPKLKNFVEDMPDRYLISNSLDEIYSDYHMSDEIKHKGLAIAIKERTDGTAEFTVITYRMPRLFAKIIGILSLKGFNIVRARLYTGKSGLVVRKILISNWRSMWWEGMKEQIKDNLNRLIIFGEEFPIPSRKNFSETLLYQKRFEIFVEIDNETSDRFTILELHLPDRLGLLYDISTQLYMLDLDIISAVINTEEGVAQDVFYLQYGGSKLNAEVIINVLNLIWTSEINLPAESAKEIEK
jgi:[protein-PII] uridylyltransferase